MEESEVDKERERDRGNERVQLFRIQVLNKRGAGSIFKRENKEDSKCDGTGTED